jgi:hypothetical protein
MGQDWRPDMAFSTDLICVYLQEIEAKISGATSFMELNRWVTIGTYSVIMYLVSLRGFSARPRRTVEAQYHDIFSFPLWEK